MDIWEFLLLLLVAGICGALGQAIAGVSRGGCIVSIALGFVGAAVGLGLARALNLPSIVDVQIGEKTFPIVWSIIGSALFVAIISLLTRPRNPRRETDGRSWSSLERHHRSGISCVPLVGISAEQGFGERGGVVARSLERLPFAQAETRLDQVVRDLLNAQQAGGGITGRVRRWLQASLVGSIRRYTLARFREEGAQQGGVDLHKVQVDLESQVDDALIARLKRSVNLWTVLVMVGLPVQVFALIFVVIALLK